MRVLDSQTFACNTKSKLLSENVINVILLADMKGLFKLQAWHNFVIKTHKHEKRKWVKREREFIDFFYGNFPIVSQMWALKWTFLEIKINYSITKLTSNALGQHSIAH